VELREEFVLRAKGPNANVENRLGQGPRAASSSAERVRQRQLRSMAERLLRDHRQRAVRGFPRAHHCDDVVARQGGLLRPEAEHSGFYGTSLDLLLSYLGADTLVLAGFVGDICVQSTAHDAFLRDHRVVVASDAVASEDAPSNRRALEWMRGFARK